MIRLRQMKEEEFEAYKAHSIEEYAREISRDYEIDIETARKDATEQTDNRLSQGLQTPGNFMYCIEEQRSSGTTHIGYLAYSIWPGKNFAWLDEIEIFEPYQKQGNGKRALVLMERELLEKGITSISLHVFASNEQALGFYQTQGFRFTGHQMKKDLEKSSKT